MAHFGQVFLIVSLVCFALVAAVEQNVENALSKDQDLDTAATSAKLLNLGSLFGQYPNYGYGYGSNSYYPSSNGYRPSGYRPTNYYPTTGSGSYYPSTGYYPSSGYYPSTSWTGSQYPSTGYYPSTSSGYYPNTGTNILGSNEGYGGYSGYNRYGGGGGYDTGNTGYGSYAGYGGYGGNGGLHQYSGYWNPDYTGQRNRGYGYMSGTDRYGLPQRDRDRNYDSSRDRDRDRDHISVGYRGYD